MPSPESPAKRMTARSMTSFLVFDTGGTSASVDISWPKPPLSMGSPASPRGSVARIQNEAVRERMASQADRREPTDKGYHNRSCAKTLRGPDVHYVVQSFNLTV